MNAESQAVTYLLHTLHLHGFNVPSVGEGVRRRLLTEADWQRTVELFRRWAA